MIERASVGTAKERDSRPGWHGLIVVLVAAVLVAWGFHGLYRHINGEGTIYSTVSDMNSRLSKTLPETIDVDGRTLDVLASDLSLVLIGDGFLDRRPALDARFQVRDRKDPGLTTILTGRVVSLVVDLEEGLAAFGEFEDLTFERPGSPDAGPRVIPNEPASRDVVQAAAFDVYRALSDEIVRIPVLRWSPSEMPRPATIQSTTLTFKFDIARFALHTSPRDGLPWYLTALAIGVALGFVPVVWNDPILRRRLGGPSIVRA